MNTYIQDKLDEFNDKYIRFGEYFRDGDRSETGRLLIDSTTLLKSIEQSLTDYHNHIVEKWEHDIKLLKLIHKQELDSIALKSLEDFMEWSELRKSLQDTNK